MQITLLYVILAFGTLLLVGVGVAIYLRVRRLSQASETQFQRAVEEIAADAEPKHEAVGNG